MPRGVVMKRDLAGVKMANQARVSEDVTRGWYADGPAKHPYEGETKPLQEDPQYRPGDGKYSWFKAPRYDGEPCEVGPLARVLVAYAKGQKDIVITSYSIHYTKLYELMALKSTAGFPAFLGSPVAGARAGSGSEWFCRPPARARLKA